jgi:hypothetical protein
MFIVTNTGRGAGDSGPFQLPAVQKTADFTIDRGSIRAGDGSVRIQVRAIINVEFDGDFPADPVRCGVEVFDNTTGETKVFQGQPLPQVLTPNANG